MCRVILAVGEELRVPHRWWGHWTSNDKVADELTTLAEEMTTFFLGQEKEPPSYYQVGVFVEGSGGGRYADIWKRCFDATDVEGVLVELESCAGELERLGVVPKASRERRGPSQRFQKVFEARRAAEEAAREEREGS
jgi:hypothetical protein